MFTTYQHIILYKFKFLLHAHYALFIYWIINIDNILFIYISNNNLYIYIYILSSDVYNISTYHFVQI